MASKLYKDKEWLEKQLVDKERTPTEVATDFDITSSAINYWKRKLNITLPTDWTENEVAFLKEHAHDMSATDIAEELGRTQNSVNHYAHRHDISMSKPRSVYADKISKNRREYGFDEDFFAEDTPETNYWAGALLADGCVRERDKNSHTISLEISRKDRSWLKKFKRSLNAEHPIFIHGDFVGLKIHSNKMFNDLNRFGVIPRKTYKDIRPSVDDAMLPHFIRGLLDGDGCITRNSKRGTVKVSLVNNNAISNWVKDNINRLLDISGCLYPHSNSDIAWNWEISSKKDLEIFGKWLYQNAEVFMNRKYDRYVNYGLLTEDGHNG